MTHLYRSGAELSSEQLTSLELDGLLTPVTRHCWVATGEPVSENVRAQALEVPPFTSVAYSHQTAFWVWWGEGMAPAITSVSATKRKRMRTYTPNYTCFENIVPPEHVASVGGVNVTSRHWTIYDLLHELCDTHSPGEATIAQARAFLLRIPAEVRASFARYLVSLYRRSRLARIKRLATQADPLIAGALRRA